MKSIAVLSLGVLMAFSVFADGQHRQLTPAQIERGRKIRSERFKARVEKEGGIVTGVKAGKELRLVNAQTGVNAAEVDNIVQTIKDTLRIPVVVTKGNPDVKCPFGVAEGEFADKNVGGVIALVENEKFPRLTIRPEEHTAIINVSELKKDAPDEEKLARRLRKEVWRGFGYAMGAANSGYQPCVMRDIASLADLDSQPIAILSPDPLMKVTPALDKMGFGKLLRTTYKRACEEGWAAAPTNDVQRAIMAAVKAEQSKEPEKAIKIKYDPKKGR